MTHEELKAKALKNPSVKNVYTQLWLEFKFLNIIQVIKNLKFIK